MTVFLNDALVIQKAVRSYSIVLIFLN